MDIFLVFLLSTGFVGGLFVSLQKSAKKFFALLSSLLLVSVCVSPIVKTLEKQGVFENEIECFVTGNVLPNSEELFEDLSENDEKQLIEKSDVPVFFKPIVLNLFEISSEKKNIASGVSHTIYISVLTVVTSVVLFVIFYIVSSLIFGKMFKSKSKNTNMFFTKRLIGGFLGFAKNMIVFVCVIFVLNFFFQITGITELGKLVDLSILSKIGKDEIEKNISAFIGGIY